MTRVAVVTTEGLGERLAGPAIRAWHMAEELQLAGHDVRLVSTVGVDPATPGASFTTVFADPAGMVEHARWADVVVTHPGALRTHPAVGGGEHCVVVDIYDPFHLENLEPGGRTLGERTEVVDHLTSVINDSLLRGDFFLCASERQRDFWLGSLAALGRVNPATYDDDPGLGRLVGVAPFGMAATPPVRRAPAMRGVLHGVGADDRIVLWAGGVYDWFDPLTLVEAIDRVRRDVPSVRLVFMGMAHPNPALPEMGVAAATRSRARELGLTDVHVFFNEGWVAYDERADYLLEADVGVSTHRAHIETAFSFRTRLLDYVWARLPYVTSDGDVFADLARTEEVGLAVPPGDVDALAEALHALLTDEVRRNRCRERLAAVAPRFTWSEALRPLLAYCAAPRRAPDRALRATTTDGPSQPPPPVPAVDRAGRLYRAVRRRLVAARSRP